MSPQLQNLNMQEFRIERLADGTASTDAATVGQVTAGAITVSGGNGLVAKTGASTYAARTLTAPAAGIGVSNGDGVAGNPTLALANDLSAIEALASTGFAVRTASDTWAQRSIASTGSGLGVIFQDGVSGNPTIALANDVAAIEALSSTGIAVRTGTDAWAQRTITAGGTTGISVTNGDGVSGNPALTIAAPTTWTPTLSAESGTFTSTTIYYATYLQLNGWTYASLAFDGTTSTGTTSINFTLPVATPNLGAVQQGVGAVIVDTATAGGFILLSNNSTTAKCRKADATNFGTGAGRTCIASFCYRSA